MGDLARTVGNGIGGLVGGSIAALGQAFDTIVGQFQAWLPGPLFPIVVGVVALGFLWWLFRK
jgi:hypothetical protein